MTVDLKMEGDTVTDFSHDVKACALGQASSSIMARNVVGAKADELRSLRETVRRMLKENGAPPGGKWADIAVLEPVRDYKARHASTLLTFDAVTAAIDQIEAKRRAAWQLNKSLRPWPTGAFPAGHRAAMRCLHAPPPTRIGLLAMTWAAAAAPAVDCAAEAASPCPGTNPSCRASKWRRRRTGRPIASRSRPSWRSQAA